MCVRRLLCSVLAALCCICFARSALAAAPDRGYLVVETRNNVVVIEIGRDATYKTLDANFGAQFKKSTGYDLGSLEGLEALQALNPETTIPVCWPRGNGAIYKGAKHTEVWASCPTADKTLWLIAGRMIQIPLVEAKVETFSQQLKRWEKLDGCEDVSCVKANLKNPQALASLKAGSDTTTAGAATPTSQKSDADAASADEMARLKGELASVRTELAAAYAQIKKMPPPPTGTPWHSHWGWLVAALVLFLGAAALGYSLYRERNVSNGLRTKNDELQKAFEALQKEYEDSKVQTTKEQEGTHKRFAAEQRVLEEIVTSLMDRLRLAESATVTARGLTRAAEEALRRAETTVERMTPELAAAQAQNAQFRAQEGDRKIAIAALTEGREKIAGLLAELAETINHLMTHRFTVEAMRKRLKQLKPDDSKRKDLEQRIASNERGIQHFLSQLRLVEERLIEVLTPLTEASVHLTGHPPLDMQIVEQAIAYRQAREDELAAARGAREEAQRILEAAQFEARRNEEAAAERSTQLDAREARIQSREDQGVLVLHDVAEERTKRLAQLRYLLAMVQNGAGSRGQVIELPSDDLEDAGDEGVETSQVRSVVDPWGLARLKDDIHAINASIGQQAVPLTPSLLEELGAFLTHPFVVLTETFGTESAVGQAIPIRSFNSLWVIGQVWQNLTKGERDALTSPPTLATASAG